MVSLNKSFLWGIAFASVTWVISLYLFWQLSSTNSTTLMSTQFEYSPSNEMLKRKYDYNNGANMIVTNANDIHDPYIKKKWRGPKDLPHYKHPKPNNVNSDKLIQSLRPVPVLDTDLSELGMVKTFEDQRIRDEGYKVHAFNTLVSQALSYHREIPDTRHKLCKNQTYPKDLPVASIIICFYNEHFQTLIRTIHSILDRTPSAILQEIILVDDYSDIEDLHSNIKEYIDTNLDSRVRLLKTRRREGLIRARMYGANQATGKVIVFLDSHVEVNGEWLEPLVARIATSPTTVVMPVIDTINPDTFVYMSSPLVRGGFNWGLHFKWENLPTGTLAKDEDFVKPIKSPTMAGGLFAMDRKYFKDLGEYDSGMDIWGGENLEISFRIWQCGGRLELLPCSRVGHVFRRRRPYGAPHDTQLRNSLRLAHVWMDEYKQHFINQRPDTLHMPYGDITHRLELRQQLHCKPFSWYLQNVYPELILPTDDDERLKKKHSALQQNHYQPWHSRKRNYLHNYQIRLSNSTLCIQSSTDEKTKGSSLVLAPCIRVKHQMWYETDKSELVLGQLLCMEAGEGGGGGGAAGALRIAKCHEAGANQAWKHIRQNRTPIYNMAAGTCLAVKKSVKGALVSMELCTQATLNQWDLVR